MVHPKTDRLTLVMITWNRRDAALSAARAIREEHPGTRLIIVDNGSTDGTAEALEREAPEVEVVRAPTNLGAAGRTLGVRRAGTPYVAFVDDDSGWDRATLVRAAALLDAYEDIGVVTARMTVGEAEAEDPLNALLAAAPLGWHRPSGRPLVLGFLACAAVVRTEAYLAVGGFHERFGVGGEETLLALDLAAAGWPCVYDDGLTARHAPDPQHPRPQRAARMVRNDLWTTWLRRPLPVCARRTGALLRRAPRDPASREGLLMALRGLPWVVRQRRRLPAALERQAAQLFD
jgi:N-acetylglucosaminyl-diphospho-decaprenol L-rhamnosyltransferase